MAPRGYPPDILAQAASMLAACAQIDPTFQTCAISQAAFANAVVQTQAIQAQIEVLEQHLADLRHRRDMRLVELWGQVRRMRALVKGVYGEGSPEYELVVGTRLISRELSDRKPQA